MIEPDPLDKSLHGLERSSTVFTIMATVVILVVLISSIYTNVRVVQITNQLQSQQNQLRAQARETTRQNAVARVASCKQYNVQQHRSEQAFEDSANVLVAQAPAHPTAAQRAAIAAYLKANRAKGRADFPLRDCSPAGIAKYLNQKEP